MSSLALPREAWCKRFVLKLVTGRSTCPVCGCAVSFRRTVTYGWCHVCRQKIRPKAATWSRGSKLTYQQIFLLLSLSGWGIAQSDGTIVQVTSRVRTILRAPGVL